MQIEDQLQSALRVLADARHALTRVRELLPNNTDLRKALRELEDAEDKITSALRDLPRALEPGA